MRGETTFSNKVHIVNSTSSGFSRETTCALLSWSKLENVCVCICFFCYFTLSWIFYHNIFFLCQWWFHISIFTIKSFCQFYCSKCWRLQLLQWFPQVTLLYLKSCHLHSSIYCIVDLLEVLSKHYDLILDHHLESGLQYQIKNNVEIVFHKNLLTFVITIYLSLLWNNLNLREWHAC